MWRILCKLLIIFVFLYDNVYVKCNNNKKSRYSTTTEGSRNMEVVTRIPPPPFFSYTPDHTFDGVDYDPQISPKERWNYMTKDYSLELRRHYYCMYENIRCIRFRSSLNWVCAVTVHVPYYYNYISKCELEYENCFRGKQLAWVTGDGFQCEFSETRQHYVVPNEY